MLAVEAWGEPDVDSNAAAALSSLNSEALGQAQALLPRQTPSFSVEALAHATAQPIHTIPGGAAALAAATQSLADDPVFWFLNFVIAAFRFMQFV